MLGTANSLEYVEHSCYIKMRGKNRRGLMMQLRGMKLARPVVHSTGRSKTFGEFSFRQLTIRQVCSYNILTKIRKGLLLGLCLVSDEAEDTPQCIWSLKKKEQGKRPVFVKHIHASCIPELLPLT